MTYEENIKDIKMLLDKGDLEKAEYEQLGNLATSFCTDFTVKWSADEKEMVTAVIRKMTVFSKKYGSTVSAFVKRVNKSILESIVIQGKYLNK